MQRWLWLEFVLLAALWGASFLLMRLGASEMGAVPAAGVRVGVAMVVLLPVMWWAGHARALRTHLAPVLVVGVLNSALPFALFAYAVLSITTGLSAILNATVPLFGALVAWAWLKERPSGTKMLGLAIGFVGVALLSWGKASFKPGGSGWAVMACLLATLCYGVSASYTKRFLTGVPPLATAAGSQIGATLGLLLPTLWLWPAGTISPQAWLGVISAGVFCTALAYILFFRLIERAGPSKTLTVTFMIPLFALFYGAVLANEAITSWMVGCGVLILVGIGLATGLVPRRKSS